MLCLYFSFLITVPVVSQNITSAFIPNLDPFSFLNAEGELSGFYIDLLTALTQEMDFSLQYNRGTWGENFELGKNGEIDLLIAVTYTAERAEYLDYLSEPVLSGYTQVVRAQGSDIESVLDLDGKRVGIMSADQNGQAFLDFIQGFDIDPVIRHYDTYPMLMEAIIDGEVEAGAIVNLLNIEEYRQISRTSIIFNAFSTTFATAKGKNPEFMAALNKQIIDWKNDPNSPYFDIFNHYFGIDQGDGVPRWLITGSVLLLLVSVASWILVQILTRKLRSANSLLAQWAKTLEERVESRSKELTSTQLKLIESEKMASLGNMVAGVAHEINTPIGVALTASSFLIDHVLTMENKYKAGELSQERFHQFVENSVSSSQMVNGNLLRAADIIQSFKEVSIDQTRDEAREIELKEYAKTVLTNLYPKIKRTSHQYKLEADDVVVITQPGSISQIITNLFENALVHGFQDIEEGIIDIWLKILDRDQPVLEIGVKDNGTGIDADIRANMFEPFVSSRKFEGSSGLGLSIVHNLVTQKLGGEITYNSKPDEGTEFIITFPVTYPDKTQG